MQKRKPCPPVRRGGAIGMVAGGIVGYLGKSSGGTCPLTCNPLRSALLLGAIGALIGMSFVRLGPRLATGAGMRELQAIVTTTEFDKRVLGADKPVLVDFYATWCGYCKQLAPTIDQLAGEYSGRADFFKVDVDKSPELAQRYSVSSLPTVLVFRGGKVAKVIVGLQDANKYRTALDAAIKGNERITE